MSRRHKIIQFLEDHEQLNDKAKVFDSLVEAMSDSQFVDLMEYITRVEDWRFHVEEDGSITDSERAFKVVGP